MFRVALKFGDGARYAYTEKELDLCEGHWRAPFPNVFEDSLLAGVIDSWTQYPEGAPYWLAVEHGEPVEITVTLLKPQSSPEGVYRFVFNAGNVGSKGVALGTFVATADEVAAGVGQWIVFEEINGVRTMLSTVLRAEDITLVTDDLDFVDLFKRQDMSMGYNPLSLVVRLD